MKINKDKCNAWLKMIFAIIRMTKELSDEEYRYIKAMLSIEYGKAELQELNEKDKGCKTA